MEEKRKNIYTQAKNTAKLEPYMQIDCLKKKVKDKE